MSEQDRWLLPEGVEEILPIEARRLELMRRRVLDLFYRWGYQLVMPPMIEYLESLLTGVGREMDLQTFKLTDQLSGRLMGIRPDMTPQAARIDAHYLKSDTPLRLCYAGPVLRTRPDEFAGSREPLQLGAELFGHMGWESDAEVLSLMISMLNLIGVRDLHIDLSHMGVFRGLAREAALQPEQETALFEALQRKAKPDISKMLSDWRITGEGQQRFMKLVDLNGDARVLEQAQALYGHVSPLVTQALEELQAVVAGLAKRMPSQPLYFDLAELSGYSYHTGVVFSAFIPGHGWAIAKGGRYDGIGRAFGRARPATGFSTDLKELAELASIELEPVTGILAPDEDDAELYQEIARLRDQGERVVVKLAHTKNTVEEMGCDRRLVKQKGTWTVVEI